MFWSWLCQVCSGVILGKWFLTLSMFPPLQNRGSLVISASAVILLSLYMGLCSDVTSTQLSLSLASCFLPPSNTYIFSRSIIYVRAGW